MSLLNWAVLSVVENNTGHSSSLVDECHPLRLFVTGFHHSGTTLMQHMALQHVGYDIQSRFREHYPSLCNPQPIVKQPSNTWYSVILVVLIHHFVDSAPVVFMHRDAPNTVWSVMKRFALANTTRSVRETGGALCYTRCTWWVVRSLGLVRKGVDVHLHSLASNGQLPDEIKTVLGDSARSGRTLADVIPPSTSHERRREWQVTHAIYPDDLDLCYKEAPRSIWESLESCEDCGSCYTWPFLHVVIVSHLLLAAGALLLARKIFRIVVTSRAYARIVRLYADRRSRRREEAELSMPVCIESDNKEEAPTATSAA